MAINTMLDNGIRVYIYPGEPPFKAAVYDGWICLGSASFVQLSLVSQQMNIATSSPVAVQAFLDKMIVPNMRKL